MTDEECGSLQIKEKRETKKKRERKKEFLFIFESRTEQKQRKERGGKRKTRMEWALQVSFLFRVFLFVDLV